MWFYICTDTMPRVRSGAVNRVNLHDFAKQFRLDLDEMNSLAENSPPGIVAYHEALNNHIHPWEQVLLHDDSVVTVSQILTQKEVQSDPHWGPIVLPSDYVEEHGLNDDSIWICGRRWFKRGDDFCSEMNITLPRTSTMTNPSYDYIPDSVTGLVRSSIHGCYPVCAISNIAFVFLPGWYEDGTCQQAVGMANAYVGLLDIDHDNKIAPLNDFHPFRNPVFMSSLSKRMFGYISTVNTCVTRSLMTDRPWPRNSKIIRIPGLPYEFFHYLAYTIEQNIPDGSLDICLTEGDVKRIYKYILCDLSMVKQQADINCVMIRLTDAPDMEALRRTLGSNAFMSPQMCAPRISDSENPRKISKTTNVRAVVCDGINNNKNRDDSKQAIRGYTVPGADI